MTDVRIDPEEARRDLGAGRAILVCGYDDEEKCNKVKIDGALTLAELRRRAPTLPKDQELIFYCA